jgi:DMSO/TMAO reductase YedYZ molybdopterin-dependent catalytic subunit
LSFRFHQPSTTKAYAQSAQSDCPPSRSDGAPSLRYGKTSNPARASGRNQDVREKDAIPVLRPPQSGRRELLKMLPLAGAAVLLHPTWRSRALEQGLALSDATSAWMFDPSLRAPTHADAEVTPFDRFPLNSYLVHDPEIDVDEWRLDVSGLVSKPGQYTLDALRRLPRVTQNTRHICIEGWDVIGSFGGVRLADLLAHVDADSKARFLEVACADDYYESLDMATARHPQSLMCDEMYGRPLTREHGAPLRLVLPTKLGYKQAKYMVSLRVSDVLGSRRGYWVDQGYSWFGGL